MKVKEIMTKEVASVKPDDNIKDALGILMQKEISGLPVIDAQGKLVGMFTEKDVLRSILPHYVDKVGMFIYEENPKSVKKKFQDLANFKVEKIMRREVITIDEDATLCEVAHRMVARGIRRLPVLDKEKRVVGIVARGQVLESLIKEYGL